MKRVILSFILLWTFVSVWCLTDDYRIINSRNGKELTLKTLAGQLSGYDVVFFGEFHDDAILHQLEREILPELYRVKPNMVISMEMFERDNQQALDRYLQGEYSETDLNREARLWPNYDTDYKPIIEFAKLHKIRVLAANTPRKYAAMVAQKGLTALDSLSKEESPHVARKFVLRDDEYKTRFLQTMQGMNGPHGMPIRNKLMENMYAAQCMKDDTMAESIHEYQQEHKNCFVIHYNGSFHSDAHLGTAQKLALLNPKLKIAVISPVSFLPHEKLVADSSMYREGEFLILVRREPEADNNRNDMPSPKVATHHIKVELMPDIHYLKGKDTIEFPRLLTPSDTLYLSPLLKISKIESKDQEIPYQISLTSDGYQGIRFVKRLPETTVTIHYEGRVYAEDPNQWGMISDNPKEGVYLPAGCWYPDMDFGPANFEVIATSPHPTRLVCSGKEEISLTQSNKYIYNWVSDYPYENLTLFGGKYAIKSKQVGETRLSVYLRAINQDDAVQMLDTMESYLKDYEKLFGKYPGNSINLVENFLPSGMSFPDLLVFPHTTFASSEILQSPTVLGHEMSRLWWGNGVYANKSGGNWTDVLNNFIANYYWLEAHRTAEDAMQWRKNALQDINFLTDAHSYPLKDFMFADTKFDAIVGFQKGAMFLYEVKRRIGDESFFSGLRSFAGHYLGREASWEMLLQCWLNLPEVTHKEELQSVFQQYLNRTDYAIVSLGDVKQSGDRLKVEIKQHTKVPYHLLVPVHLTMTNHTQRDTTLVCNDLSTLWSFTEADSIKALELDPSYQCCRALSKIDLPYSLRKTLHENPLIIIPEKSTRQAEIDSWLELLRSNGFAFDSTTADKVTEKMLASRSFIVLGDYHSNDMFTYLQGRLPQGFDVTDKGFAAAGTLYSATTMSMLLSFVNPFQREKSMSLWVWNSDYAVKSLRSMFRYVNYSWQVLVDGTEQPLVQGNFAAEDDLPLRWIKK